MDSLGLQSVAANALWRMPMPSLYLGELPKRGQPKCHCARQVVEGLAQIRYGSGQRLTCVHSLFYSCAVGSTTTRSPVCQGYFLTRLAAEPWLGGEGLPLL